MREYKFYGWERATVRDVYGNTPRDYYDLLSSLWCEKTCAPRMRKDWKPENKTLGQCSITAFLMQDLFGGRVYGVPLADGNFHCFNDVDGCVFDLTSEQFGEEKLDYKNCPEQYREIHFAKAEKRERYEYLKERLKDRLPVKKVLIYIHGMGGSPEEAGHYRALFPGYVVFTPEYTSIDPVDGGRQIGNAVKQAAGGLDEAVLVANSIGAFLCMHAEIDGLVARSYFISPIVDMEKLIGKGLRAAGATEEDLQKKGTIHAPDGTELSWDYLCRLRAHPADWKAPTDILYGSSDTFTSLEDMTAFAQKHGARLTVMEGGEHWFHTDEQMAFLDGWIDKGEGRNK